MNHHYFVASMFDWRRDENLIKAIDDLPKMSARPGGAKLRTMAKEKYRIFLVPGGWETEEEAYNIEWYAPAKVGAVCIADTLGDLTGARCIRLAGMMKSPQWAMDDGDLVQQAVDMAKRLKDQAA